MSRQPERDRFSAAWPTSSRPARPRVAMRGFPGGLAPAVVLGDTDLVRPLVLADIPVAVVTPPGDSARRSRRYTTAMRGQGQLVRPCQ